MSKKYVKREYGTVDIYELEGTVNEVVKKIYDMVESAARIGFINIAFKVDGNDYEQPNWILYGKTLETDCEYEERLKKESVVKQKRYKKYLELKKEFEENK